MRFEVLGPVRVIRPDGTAAALPPRVRTLLAALVAARGRPTSADRLIDEVWPGDRPAGTASTLQVYVSTLSQIGGDRLRTVGGG